MLEPIDPQSYLIPEFRTVFTLDGYEIDVRLAGRAVLRLLDTPISNAIEDQMSESRATAYEMADDRVFLPRQE